MQIKRRGKSKRIMIDEDVKPDMDSQLQDDPQPGSLPHTVVIPCHHIRLGDFLMLKGTPCQIIKISTSAVTGQYRYLGVSLFTKKLHEETSTIYEAGPNAAVQTMMGPIFTQYRVLDLKDGHVVAMTEAGDIKRNIPVIDQSNLWSRLTSVFESGRGSVRVLILNDGGRELVVDVKVIHGSRPDTDKARVDERPILPKLAFDGQLARMVAALEDGADINDPDENGKTAIFHAIEQRHRRLIGELIDRDINLDMTDNTGKTVLDYAVGIAKNNSIFEWVPERLMTKGASLTNGKDPQTWNLLISAAKGDSEQVQDILDSFDTSGTKSKVDDTDRLGYTALHEAAYFGQYEVAKKLLLFGARTELRAFLGGDTVLHAVVERRAHRSFLGEGRNNSAPLHKDHPKVFELLLNHGADVSYRRPSDMKTVQELVFEKLKAEGLSLVEQSTLQQILIILKGHSLQSVGLREQNTIQSATIFAEHDSLKHFRSLSVQCHPFGSSEDSEKIPIDAFLQRPSPIPQDKEWMWIHLPKNNVQCQSRSFFEEID
ncbi:uncharacterized protein N0V96_008908 [Colletotrichum fioriniae]|uniref:uncharacterized protein n=1 Tax=Colletotrichum fioriniae TaxID=710243 RepID=UPI0032DAE8EB|nr:hypothetical protein N0V96_008908 [Colletotrichum fioriniae]